MKKLFLIFLFVGSTCMAQSKWTSKVGDTLLYSKDWKFTQKDSARSFIVLKHKEWNKEIRKYIYTVDFFRQDTVSKEFYKSEVFSAYRFGSFSRQGKNIDYWKNGNKSAEGEMKSNKRIGFWTEWYENGQKKYERRYFLEKDMLKEDYRPSELINFWNKKGEQTVINGNGDYFHKNKDGGESKGGYKNYKKDGVWTGTRKDSSLYYQENYIDGILEKGESWDKDGKKYTYNVVFENTKYVGGQEALAKVVRENFKTPKYAIKRGIEGVMLIGFEINKKGKIQNVKLKRKLCGPCDEAALKVVEKFDEWTPAKRRGQPVIVKFTLPIRINLVSN